MVFISTAVQEGVCSRTIASNYTEVTGEEGVVSPEGRRGKNKK